MLAFIRKVFFWNYARNTWQWDVLCVLCLVFIFLTPKTWFTNGERGGAQEHQKPSSTVLVASEVVENAADKAELQQRVRTVTGRTNAEVLSIRKSFDSAGKAQGYEVDIK